MNADSLELLAPGIGDCCLTAVRQHDRRAVSSMQCKQLHPGLELGGFRKHRVNVFRADRLHIRNSAPAEQRKRLRRDRAMTRRDMLVGHGTRLLSTNAS